MGKHNIDVLFLIEHVDRELDAVACLAEQLMARFGITSAVRHYYFDLFFSVHRYNPKIVVFPFFYGVDHFHLRKYVEIWPNARFVNLGWEQILVKVDLSMKTPRDDAARTRVHHMCWTRQHFDFMFQNGVKADNLHLTGNPVMKFYDTPYREYFKTREQLAEIYSLDPQKKWVLFPENYFFAFLSDSGMKRLETMQNANSEYLDQAKIFGERSLTKLFAWTKALDRAEDPIFIIRPRPSTSQRQMTNFMRRAVGSPGKNVRVIKAETAREWILASHHVISSHSTTLIEAALAGKLIHLFSPEIRPEALQGEWHHLVPELTNEEAFLEAIRSDTAGQTGESLANWSRERLLPHGDPFFSTVQVIAGLLHKSGQRGQVAYPRLERSDPASIVMEKARKFIQRRPFLHRRTRGYEYTSWGRAQDIFGADDVARRLSRWRETLSRPA